MNKNVLAAIAGAVAIAISSVTSAAFPDRQVTLVVPYPPGGSTDGVTRVVAQQLAAAWGQPVVIENRPGADGQIGNAYVAKAKPDGYTILVVSTTFTVSKSLFPSLPYDPAGDFTPIASMAIAPYYLVVGNAAPVKDTRELIAMAKADPGKYNYSISSSGNYLAAEMFKKAAGITLQEVRYKGGAGSMMAAVTGDVTFTLETPMTVKPLVEGGKLRVFAVTGDTRSPVMPNVPTFSEQGIAGADIGSWLGLAGPKGMPPDIVTTINAAVRAALANAEVKKSLLASGFTPLIQTKPEFDAFMQSEFNRYEAIVKANNLTPP